MRDIPEQALAFGFVNEPIGSHTSRTIMLPELRALLTACPADTQLEDYRLAVVEDNVLRKATVATRKGSFRQLRELYGLAPDICIFRALRDLWDSDDEAQPLLAILCATARDPILRSTASVIVELSPGDHITPEDLAAAVQRDYPDRYLESVRKVIGRNTIGSWRQSGHLLPAPKRERGRGRARWHR